MTGAGTVAVSNKKIIQEYTKTLQVRVCELVSRSASRSMRLSCTARVCGVNVPDGPHHSLTMSLVLTVQYLTLSPPGPLRAGGGSDGQ
jgi:hypothetical protein